MSRASRVAARLQDRSLQAAVADAYRQRMFELFRNIIENANEVRARCPNGFVTNEGLGAFEYLKSEAEVLTAFIIDMASRPATADAGVHPVTLAGEAACDAARTFIQRRI